VRARIAELKKQLEQEQLEAKTKATEAAKQDGQPAVEVPDNAAQ